MTVVLVILGFLTVVTTLVTAVVTLVKTYTQSAAIAQIHVLVNSRLAAVIAWGDQLATILEHHGIDVPPPAEAANLEARNGIATSQREDEPGKG